MNFTTVWAALLVRLSSCAASPESPIGGKNQIFPPNILKKQTSSAKLYFIFIF
jgi:hypothetical protein